MNNISKLEMNSVFKKVEGELSKSFDTIKTKYGYQVKFGKGSYDGEGNLYIKLEALKDGALSAEAQRYNANRIWMGLPPLGTVMKIGVGSREYTITGMNTTGSKIKATSGDAKYLLTNETVKAVWSSMKAKEAVA